MADCLLDSLELLWYVHHDSRDEVHVIICVIFDMLEGPIEAGAASLYPSPCQLPNLFRLLGHMLSVSGLNCSDRLQPLDTAHALLPHRHFAKIMTIQSSIQLNSEADSKNSKIESDVKFMRCLANFSCLTLFQSCSDKQQLSSTHSVPRTTNEILLSFLLRLPFTHPRISLRIPIPILTIPFYKHYF